MNYYQESLRRAQAAEQEWRAEQADQLRGEFEARYPGLLLLLLQGGIEAVVRQNGEGCYLRVQVSRQNGPLHATAVGRFYLNRVGVGANGWRQSRFAGTAPRQEQILLACEALARAGRHVARRGRLLLSLALGLWGAGAGGVLVWGLFQPAVAAVAAGSVTGLLVLATGLGGLAWKLGWLTGEPDVPHEWALVGKSSPAGGGRGLPLAAVAAAAR